MININRKLMSWNGFYGSLLLFFYAVAAEITGYTIIVRQKDSCNFLTIGTSSPPDDLWESGYRVAYAGKAFGKTVLTYTF